MVWSPSAHASEPVVREYFWMAVVSFSVVMECHPSGDLICRRRWVVLHVELFSLPAAVRRYWNLIGVWSPARFRVEGRQIPAVLKGQSLTYFCGQRVALWYSGMGTCEMTKFVELRAVGVTTSRGEILSSSCLVGLVHRFLFGIVMVRLRISLTMSLCQSASASEQVTYLSASSRCQPRSMCLDCLPYC